MKRLTKDEWRALNIFNPYDLCIAGGKGVYVAYTPQITGRMSRSAKWQVIKPGFKTDPDGHWTHDGHKTFSVSRREDKEGNRLAALAWASEQFSIKEWEKDPWGDYHPQGTLEAAQASALTTISRNQKE